MSRDMVYEKVPPVARREGDNLVAGQNNSTIILGRDRRGAVDSGYGSLSSSGKGSGAGAMHLVVGRKTENPDPIADAATVYLSAKTDPDAQAGTAAIGSESKGLPGIVCRADCVRVTARKDIKISTGSVYIVLSSDGKAVIEGDLSLGAGAAERIIRGDLFTKLWNSHGHPTPVGVSGPPTVLMVPEVHLSARNKVN